MAPGTVANALVIPAPWGRYSVSSSNKYTERAHKYLMDGKCSLIVLPCIDYATMELMIISRPNMHSPNTFSPSTYM